MDYCEFAEWMAYHRIDPFGNERADMHAAMTLSMLYNIHRGERPAKSPSDFMLDFTPQESVGDQAISAFKQIKALQEE